LALKITLKPHEKMIISGAVITNGPRKTEIYIENKVPILREQNVMTEERADSPCRRIYFAIQLMYIDGANLSSYHQKYWQLVQDLAEAAPSFLPQIEKINANILKGQHYQALKLARKMIALEREVIRSVQ
jgi:flagellar protein FlbT